jgi:hypothetical protein
MRRPLSCYRLGLLLFCGVYAVDRLLHEGPTLANSSINLLGKNLEALVSENDRFALPRSGNRRHDGEMISSVQGDGLGEHPHIAIEAAKLGVHIVETFAQKGFDRWGGVQKMLESSFNQHALADARSVGCDVKPTADALTKPNRHFAACRGFAFARRSNVPSIGLHIQIGQLLHFPTIPKSPTIETAASRYD